MFDKSRPISILLIFIIGSCFSCGQKENQLIIAVSSNMQFAYKEIADAFTKKYHIEVASVFSSSGKLTAQIIEGAPYHIFLSADLKYPKKLEKEGHTIHKVKTYAQGKLILWSLLEDFEPTSSALLTQQVKHIALANVHNAPYGIAALEYLQNSGIYEAVQDKLVYGESIGQTNQFILTKSAQMGITSLSVVLAPKNIGIGTWTRINDSAYTPINQGIVMINQKGSLADEAQLFYNFIFSSEVQEILKNFGYSVDE